jgi:anthranilate phosphoribosyltransferase
MGPVMQLREAIQQIAEERRDLSAGETADVVTAILSEAASPAQTGCLLAALRMKGETAAEVHGCAQAMLRRAVPIAVNGHDPIDIGGTGGDRSGTFNISTTAAFVVAAAGVPVLKHGNRRVTSRSGSADLIEAIGIPLRQQAEPAHVDLCLHEVGFAYLFTPAYHRFPAALSTLRREIAIRSIFNLAGPVAHPASVRRQIIGVAQLPLVALIADVLRRLGRERAFVVHGADGLDEFSIVGTTHVTEVRGETTRSFTVEPSDFGLEPARLDDIRGGDPADSARLSLEVLAGATGPRRDAVLMTVAAALVLAEKAPTFPDGVALGRQAIDSGAALRSLNRLRELSQ